jgi:thousand and one amino acid protein kinase
MEYCLGTASDIIEVQKKPLKEEEISAICKGTLSALSYLHANAKIHRDVKAGNILLTERGIVKLGDFGSASLKCPANSFVGTPFWMAPEVILAMDEGQYDGRVDVWSLGITCIELAERKPPLFHMNAMSALYHIAQSDPPTLKDPSKWSEEFVNFISKCLVKEPSERPTSHLMLQHNFITLQRREEILLTMVERSKSLVRKLDDLNYRKARKILMNSNEDKTFSTEDIDGSGSDDEHSPIETPSPSSSPTGGRRSNGDIEHNQREGQVPPTGPQASPVKSKYQLNIDRSVSVSQVEVTHNRHPMEKQHLERTQSDVTAFGHTSSSHGSHTSSSHDSHTPSSQSVRSLHVKDGEKAAKQSALVKAGGHIGFSSLRPYSLVSKQQQESALQIELKEQMIGYKRLRQSHVKQMTQLEAKLKDDKTAHGRSLERELEQFKHQCERDADKLKMRIRIELENRQRYIESEERRFLKQLRDKQEQEMKVFQSKQKKDYNHTKETYKKAYEKSDLSSADRKRLLNERKQEKKSQQHAEEELQLERLRKEAKKQMIDFKRELLEDLHKLQNSLLHEELNLSQQHKDQYHQMKQRHLESTIELNYKQLRAVQAMRLDHLERQHSTEWANQQDYSKRTEKELRKKHLLELKQHPKSLKVKENQIRKQFHDTVRIQTRQYKALEKQMMSTLPKERYREALRQQRDERMRKVAQLHSQYERTIADMLQKQTVSYWCG